MWAVGVVVVGLLVVLGEGKQYTNPVIDSNHPDPGVLIENGMVYAVTTSGDAPDAFPIMVRFCAVCCLWQCFDFSIHLVWLCFVVEMRGGGRLFLSPPPLHLLSFFCVCVCVCGLLSFLISCCLTGCMLKTSVDLVNWNISGHVFPANATGRPSWAVRDFWAPEIHRIAPGLYNVYFAARFGLCMCVIWEDSASCLPASSPLSP